MNTQQHIPCPECQTPIYFDPRSLLQGLQFSCHKCGIAIGLSTESRGVVQESLNELDKIKSGLLKGNPNPSQF